MKRNLLVIGLVLALIIVFTSFSFAEVKIGFLVKMPENPWFQDEWKKSLIWEFLPMKLESRSVRLVWKKLKIEGGILILPEQLA